MFPSGKGCGDSVVSVHYLQLSVPMIPLTLIVVNLTIKPLFTCITVGLGFLARLYTYTDGPVLVLPSVYLFKDLIYPAAT